MFSKCSMNMTLLLLQHLQPQLCLPGDYIVREGDVGDCMYFIKHGRVAIVKGEDAVAEIGQGSFFGEISLLTSEKRSASVRALRSNYVDLLKLSKGDFDEVTSRFPDELRTIVEVGEKRRGCVQFCQHTP